MEIVKKRLNSTRQGPSHVSLRRINRRLFSPFHFLKKKKVRKDEREEESNIIFFTVIDNKLKINKQINDSTSANRAAPPPPTRVRTFYRTTPPARCSSHLKNAGGCFFSPLHLREERPTKQRVRAFPWRVLVTPRQTSVIIVVFAESVHACQYRCSINEFGPSSTNYLTRRTVYVSHPIPTHRLWCCVSAGGLNHQSSIIISKAHW